MSSGSPHRSSKDRVERVRSWGLREFWGLPLACTQAQALRGRVVWEQTLHENQYGSRPWFGVYG